jgi:CTP:molybdopterin cytidylyltransferase MocA
MIAALVLAAGLGTRMRASKPLLDVGGVPSLARVLAAIDGAGIDHVIVVLGRDADLIAERVDLSRTHVVRNSAPEAGLASSMALGLAALPPSSTGVLVFHADMPFIQSTTVRAVRRLAEDGARIAAPRCGKLRGFPVYFSRACLAPLGETLSGDSGGRRFIERNPRCLELVDVSDSGCIRDLDSPEDLTPGEKEATWTTCA